MNLANPAAAGDAAPMSSWFEHNVEDGPEVEILRDHSFPWDQREFWLLQSYLWREMERIITRCEFLKERIELANGRVKQ